MAELKISIANLPSSTVNLSASAYLEKRGSYPFRCDKPARSLGVLSAENKLNGFLFGLFILDSHIYLPMKDSTITVKEGYNTLRFPYGPLIALRDAGSFGGHGLRDLSFNMGFFFNEYSNSYFKQNLNKDSVSSYADAFVRHQETIIDYLIKHKIRRELGTGLGYSSRGGFLDSVIDSVTHELKRDLLYLSRVRKIRLQLEKFATSNDKSTILRFLTINPTTDSPLVITITKEDLVNMGFLEWGGYGSHDTTINPILQSYRADQIEMAVSQVVKYLESVIKLAGDGKVNLVPIVNTMDKDIGYQVLERDIGADSHFYLPSSGIFQINTKADKNYETLLRHVAYLMLADKCGFVMKPWKDNVGDLQAYLMTDKEFIMAFTRERILTPEKIFSASGANNFYKAHKNYQIALQEYISASFRPKSSNWKALWVHPLVWTSGGHSDLYNYMKNTVIESEYLKKILNLPDVYIEKILNS